MTTLSSKATQSQSGKCGCLCCFHGPLVSPTGKFRQIPTRVVILHPLFEEGHLPLHSCASMLASCWCDAHCFLLHPNKKRKLHHPPFVSPPLSSSSPSSSSLFYLYIFLSLSISLSPRLEDDLNWQGWCHELYCPSHTETQSEEADCR